MFDTLLEWKSEQRERTRSVDVLSWGWVRELLARLQRTQHEGFEGLLSALFIGDELAAAHFGLASERVLHWWFPAYAPRFAPYSPGALLLIELARAAAEAGWPRIELGPGQERYKASFASGSARLMEGHVAPGFWGRRLGGAALHARRWARRSPALSGSKRWVRRVLRPAQPG